MHSKEFVWVIMKDYARAEDGKELRWEFVRQAQIEVPAGWLNEPCSMLEMMVGTARRMAELTDIPIRTWVTQLLNNTSLIQYHDLCCLQRDVQSEIDVRLEVINWRTYSPKGVGGLFPLAAPVEDQRRVEIWYQMNAWLIEQARS